MARKLLRLFALLVLVSGCSAAAPPNPYRIDEADFRRRVHTVALMPIQLPPDVADPEPLARKFEDLVRSRLESFGFVTMPSGIAGSVRDRVRAESGGAFDPLTGKVDQAKFEAINTRIREEFAKNHQADAFLLFGIQVVDAAFRNGVASWAGTTEQIETTGSRALRAFVGGLVSGTTPATVLTLEVEDLSGNDLYRKSGGIESLTTYGAGGFRAKPMEQLFLDDKRNLRAVDIAVRELNPNPPPDETSSSRTRGGGKK